MNVDQYISSGILELYAANALPPEEMKEVAEMVEKHARVKEELDAITEGLKKYAAMYDPGHSEELFDKIINKINESPVQEVPVEVRSAPVIPISKEKSEEAEVKKLPQQRSNGNGGYLMLIAASVILLMVSVAANIYLFTRYSDTKGELSALQNEKNALVNDANANKVKFEQTESQLKLYTDPHNKMVMMKGMPISPGSEVMVMWNTASNEVYLDVHHLPAPPEGMQYQLWAIGADGKPIDAGMLMPLKERTDQGPQQMKKITSAVAFAITLEKRGGSPTPTVDQMYVKGGV